MSETNCVGCQHKQRGEGGYCYMFRFQPSMPCAQHTNRFEAAQAMRIQTLRFTTKEQP